WTGTGERAAALRPSEHGARAQIPFRLHAGLLRQDLRCGHQAADDPIRQRNCHCLRDALEPLQLPLFLLDGFAVVSYGLGFDVGEVQDPVPGRRPPADRRARGPLTLPVGSLLAAIRTVFPPGPGGLLLEGRRGAARTLATARRDPHVTLPDDRGTTRAEA